MANFKSVLEKYDAKGNRRLPTAEEGAIERDTTLEGLLIGPSKAAASAVKNAVKGSKSAVRGFETPSIGSRVEKINADIAYRDSLRKKDWGKTIYKQNPFEPSPKELERITEKKNLAKLVNTGEDVLKKAAFNQDGSLGWQVGSDYVDYANEKNVDTNTYKQGGKVSSASKRADGIAQRGRTRGKSR